MMPRNNNNKWKEKGHGLYEESTVPEQTTYSTSANQKPGLPQRQRQRRRGDAMGVEQSHTEHAHPQHSGLIKVNQYVTNNGLDIICYKGDITKADADGIVTSENCGMPKPSMVTEALLKTANIDYYDLRDYTNHKYNTIDLTSGEVYSLETDFYGIQLQFKIIYMAIVLSYKHSTDEIDWTRHTQRLYRNILERADYKRSTSLAVPLLGSENTGAPRELAVDALIKALSEYRPKYNLTTVLLVSLDEEVLNEILNQSDEYFSEQSHIPKKRDSHEHAEHRLSTHHNQNSYGYDGNLSQANQSARRLHSDCVSSNLAKQQTSQSAFPSQKFNSVHGRSRYDKPLRVYQTQRLYPVLDNMDNQPTRLNNSQVKEPTTRPSLSARVSDNTAQMTVAHSANIQETFDKQPIEACPSSEIHPRDPGGDTNYDNTSDDIFATGTHSTTASPLDWETSEHNGGQLMGNRMGKITDEQFSDFVLIGHNNVKSNDNITRRNTKEVLVSNEQRGGQPERNFTREKEKDEHFSVEYFCEQSHVPKKRDSHEHAEHRLSTHHNENSYGYDGNVSQANQSARRLHSDCVSSNLAKQQTSQSAFPSQKFNNVHGRSRHDKPLRVYQTQRLYPVLDNMDNQPTRLNNSQVKEPTTRPSLSARVSDNTAQMTVARSANIQETLDKQPIEACPSSEIQPRDPGGDTNYDNTADDIFATGTHSTTESPLDWETSEHNGGQLMDNRKRKTTDEQFSDFVINRHNNVIPDDNITNRNTKEVLVSNEQRGGQPERNFTREKEKDEHLSGSVSNKHDGHTDRIVTREKEKDEHLSDSVTNEHDGHTDRIVTREKEKDEHLSGSVSNEHRGGQSNGNFPIEKTNEQDVSGSASCARYDKTDGNLNSRILAEQTITQSDKTIDNVTGIAAEQPVTQSDKNVDNVTGIAAEQPVTQSDKNLDNVTGIAAEQPVTQSDKTINNVTGHQPEGKMTHKVIKDISIPGYEGHGVIVLDYYFEDGIQKDKHPHPGKPYQGVRRRGFLPDNAEGQAVLLLLKKAFDCKLTFSITPSTTDENDIVTWNIPHKTNTHGGPKRNGYPDETYLSRVREELTRKGLEKDEHLSGSVSNEHDGQSDRIITREKENYEHLSGSLSNEHNGQSDRNFTRGKEKDEHLSGSVSNEHDGQSDRIVTREKEKDEHLSVSVSNEHDGQSDRIITREKEKDEHLSGSVSNEHDGQTDRIITREKENYEHLSGSLSNEHNGQSDRNFTREKEKDEHLSGSVSNEHDGQTDRIITREKENYEHLSGSLSNEHNGQSDRNFTREKEKDEHLSGSVSNGQSDRIVTRGKEKDERLSGSVSNEHRGDHSKGNFPIEKKNEQDVSGSACCGRNNRQKDGNLNAEFSAEQPVTQSDKTVDKSKPLSLISKRKVTVNQPDGKMTHKIIEDVSIPGYEGHGVIIIDYYFEDGIQTDEHPHPGKPYQGVRRRGFLPDNAEGQAVLLLLKKAFDRKLTFSITPSTTDENDIVTWNIPHKTNTHGGPQRDGYPDETYLSRVKEELTRKVNGEVPVEKSTHLVVDHLFTHKANSVQEVSLVTLNEEAFTYFDSNCDKWATQVVDGKGKYRPPEWATQVVDGKGKYRPPEWATQVVDGKGKYRPPEWATQVVDGKGKYRPPEWDTQVVDGKGKYRPPEWDTQVVDGKGKYRPPEWDTQVVSSQSKQVHKKIDAQKYSPKHEEHGSSTATHDKGYSVSNKDGYGYDGDGSQSIMDRNTASSGDIQASHSAPRWDSNYDNINLPKQQTSQSALPSEEFIKSHDRAGKDTPLRVNQPQRLYPVLDNLNNKPTETPVLLEEIHKLKEKHERKIQELKEQNESKIQELKEQNKSKIQELKEQNESKIQQLKEQNELNECKIQQLKKQNECKICFDAQMSIIFLPCKHLACCETCATDVSECPICRNAIEEKEKIYRT